MESAENCCMSESLVVLVVAVVDRYESKPLSESVKMPHLCGVAGQDVSELGKEKLHLSHMTH